MSTKHLTRKLVKHLRRQSGQGITEYVLLLSLIAVTLIGSLMSLKEIIYNVLINIPIGS